MSLGKGTNYTNALESIVRGRVLDHGKEEEGLRAIKPIRELGSVLMDTVATIPYRAMQQQLDNSFTKGQRNYWKSAYLKELADVLIELLILAISTEPALDGQQMSWARNFWEDVRPYSTGGAYVNYLSAGEDVHEAYSDARFTRLAGIKAQYDPGKLFRQNHNIPPARGRS